MKITPVLSLYTPHFRDQNIQFRDEVPTFVVKYIDAKKEIMRVKIGPHDTLCNLLIRLETGYFTQ